MRCRGCWACCNAEVDQSPSTCVIVFGFSSFEVGALTPTAVKIAGILVAMLEAAEIWLVILLTASLTPPIYVMFIGLLDKLLTKPLPCSTKALSCNSANMKLKEAAAKSSRCLPLVFLTADSI